MLRELFQEILKVFVRLKVIHLRCFGDAVKNRTGFCPMNGIDQIPVLSSDREAADAAFGGLC